MEEPICYGDTIYIEISSKVLFSLEWYHPTLYFVPRQDLCNSSFENALFKILPAQVYKDSSLVDSLSKQLNTLNFLNPQVKTDLAEELEFEKGEIENSQPALDEINESMYENAKGTPIGFGQTIQLLHLETQRFLTASRRPNQDIDAFLTLSESRTKDTYFMLRPQDPLQVHSRNVLYGTKIHLVSYKLELGLCIEDHKGDITIEDGNIALSQKQFNFLRSRSRRKNCLLDPKGSVPVQLGSTDQNDLVIRKYSSCKIREEAWMKSALLNAEYFRISYAGAFLTIFEDSEPKNNPQIFFQSFHRKNQQEKNVLSTVFQLVKVPINNQELPDEHIITDSDEIEELYYLKHVLLGKYLGVTNDELGLYEDPDAKSLLKIKMRTSNQSYNHIDLNLPVQFEYWSKDTLQGYLSMNKTAEHPTKKFKGTSYPDEYLSTYLNPTRYPASFCRSSEKEQTQATYLSLHRVQKSESTTILISESFTNSLQRFLDFLMKFSISNTWTLKDLNKNVQNLVNICENFYYKMNSYISSCEDKPIQALLREFEVYPLIYAIFLILITDATLQSRIEELQKKNKSKIAEIITSHATLGKQLKSSEEKEGFLSSGKTINIFETDEEINIENILTCIKYLVDIMASSFKTNDLNIRYNLQYFKPFLGLLFGLSKCSNYFSSAKKSRIQELMLILFSSQISLASTDNLEDLNSYETELFAAISEQSLPHRFYLDLLACVAQCKRSFKKNDILTKFINSYLTTDDNFLYVFPQLVEEDEKIIVVLQKKNSPNEPEKIPLSEFDRIMDTNNVKTAALAETSLYTTITYAISSLQLLAALSEKSSYLLNILIFKNYKYPALVKTISALKSLRMQQTSITLMKIWKNTVNNFSSPIKGIPPTLHITAGDSQKHGPSSISSLISGSLRDFIPSSEMNYIEDQGLMKIVSDIIEDAPEFNNYDVLVQVLAHKLLPESEVPLCLSLCKDVIEFGLCDWKTTLSLLKLLKEKINRDSPEIKEFWKLVSTALDKEFSSILHCKDPSPSEEVKGTKSALVEISSLSSRLTSLPKLAIDLVDKILQNQMNALVELIKEVEPVLIHLPKMSAVSEWAKTSEKLYSCPNLIFNQIEIIEDDDTLQEFEDFLKQIIALHKIARELQFLEETKLSAPETKFNTILEQLFSSCALILSKLYRLNSVKTRADSNEVVKHLSKHFDGTNPITFKVNDQHLNVTFQKILSAFNADKLLIKLLLQLGEINNSNKIDQGIVNQLKAIITVISLCVLHTNTEAEGDLTLLQLIVELCDPNQSDNYAIGILILHKILANINTPNDLLLPVIPGIFSKFMECFGPKNAIIFSNQVTTLHFALLRSVEFLLPHCPIEECACILSNLKQMWKQLTDGERIHEIDLKKQDQESLEIPILNLFQKEFFESSIEAILFSQDDEKLFGICQSWLDFLQGMKLFKNLVYLLQFELKDLMTKIINLLYFSDKKTEKWMLDYIQFSELSSYVINDLIFFVETSNCAKNTLNNQFPSFPEESNVLESSKDFVQQRNAFRSLLNIDLERQVSINLREESFKDLQCKYIFGSCLDLSSKLCLQYPFHCRLAVNHNGLELSPIVDLNLKILNEITGTKHPGFPSRKIEKFLTEMSSLEEYQPQLEILLQISRQLDDNFITRKLTPQEAPNDKESKKGATIARLKDMKKDIQKITAKFYKKFAHSCFQNEHTNWVKLTNKQLLIKHLGDPVPMEKRQSVEDKLQAVCGYLAVDLRKINLNSAKILFNIMKWIFDGVNDDEERELFQSKMKFLGFTHIICNFIALNDEKIIEEALNLMIMYVTGGNPDVQADFFAKMSHDTTNSVAQTFFSKITSLWENFKVQESKHVDFLYKERQQIIFKHSKNSSRSEPIRSSEVTTSVTFFDEIRERLPENMSNPKIKHSLTKLFRCLQLLCEGQHSNNQNFLREQKYHEYLYSNSRNFVILLRTLICEYSKIATIFNLEVGLQLFDTMNELILGEVPQNRAPLLNRAFLSAVCHFLIGFDKTIHSSSRGFDWKNENDYEEKPLYSIKKRCSQLLKTLAESSSSADREIMKKELDIPSLFKALEQLFAEYQRAKNDLSFSFLDSSDFYNYLNPMIDIFVVFRYLWPKNSEFKKAMSPKIKQVFPDDREKQSRMGLVLFEISQYMLGSIGGDM